MTGSLPDVGRPKGSAWRHLQDEGIVWEGQVLITGDDADLAALLIVTNLRLAFVRGGTVALEIERAWLDPAPVLRRTGTVHLWISPPGNRMAESLTLIARDGRDEAAVLLSLIGDHGAYGSAYRLPTYVPDTAPHQPHYPVARSRRRQPAYEESGFDLPSPMPVFSILDDDDFPPVAPRSSQYAGWEEAIAESLESGMPIPLAASIRNPNDPLRPIQGFDSKIDRDRRAWVIRIAGLILVIGLISAIASGLTPGLDDARDLIDSSPSSPTPGVVAQIDVPTQAPEPTPTTVEPTQPAGPSSTDPRDPTVVPVETALALGVGSDQPSETPTPLPQPSATTAEVVQAAQDTEEPVQTEDSTEEDPVIPPPDTSEDPTETTAPDPTAAEEETTEPDPPATSAEPEADVPAGSLLSQDATLDSNEMPAQTFEVNGLRAQISAAYRAESLPDLTLGRSSAGEWVVLLVDGVNWSSEPANIVMTDFRLASADDLATEFPLDAATGAVGSYLDLSPRLRPSESAVVPPGGYQPLALVFSIPTGLDDLVLRAGETVVALDLAFEHQAAGQLEGPQAIRPDLISGTVVEVIDGQTITADVQGDLTTVRYYGLRPLAGDACYAAEATAANAELVEGQTVYFERERRNRTESTIYLRDVWIAGENGALQLVGARLAAAGAGIPEASDPDVRYAGWLTGQSLLAQLSQTGIWSACQSPGD